MLVWSPPHLSLSLSLALNACLVPYTTFLLTHKNTLQIYINWSPALLSTHSSYISICFCFVSLQHDCDRFSAKRCRFRINNTPTTTSTGATSCRRRRPGDPSLRRGSTPPFRVITTETTPIFSIFRPRRTPATQLSRRGWPGRR